MPPFAGVPCLFLLLTLWSARAADASSSRHSVANHRGRRKLDGLRFSKAWQRDTPDASALQASTHAWGFSDVQQENDASTAGAGAARSPNPAWLEVESEATRRHRRRIGATVQDDLFGSGAGSAPLFGSSGKAGRPKCGKCDGPGKAAKAAKASTSELSCAQGSETCVTVETTVDALRKAGRDVEEVVWNWVPPFGERELYEDGSYTLSGGVASGAESGVCEQLAYIAKACVLPCQLRGGMPEGKLVTAQQVKITDKIEYDTAKGPCLKRRAKGKPPKPAELSGGISGLLSFLELPHADASQRSRSRHARHQRQLQRRRSAPSLLEAASTTSSGSALQATLAARQAMRERLPGKASKAYEPALDDEMGECICVDPCSLYNSCGP